MKRTLLIVIWSLSCLVRSLDALYDPEMVWLSWQSDPTTTMVIQWVGHGIDPHSTVEYRLQGTNTWQEVNSRYIPMPGAPKLHINRVELTGLKPDSSYQYRISSEGVTYLFRTMPANNTSKIVFVEGGDMYHDDLESMERISRVAAAQNPHFAVIGGDLAYSAGRGIAGEDTERWIIWLKSWKKMMVTPDGHTIPMLPAIGNHEVDGGYYQRPDRAKLFYTSFPLPQGVAFRVLDFGNYLSLFLLDSGHTAPVKGFQRDWLKKNLSARSRVPLKFAVYHIPAYPSIRRFENKDSLSIREAWVPVFDEFGLTVAFEHHDHDYKRTLRLKNNKPDPQGTLYMGDGCWGIKHPRINPQDRWYLVTHRPVRHFLMVIMENNRYTIKAVNELGEVFDEVSSTTPDPRLAVQNERTPTPFLSTHQN